MVINDVIVSKETLYPLILYIVFNIIKIKTMLHDRIEIIETVPNQYDPIWFFDKIKPRTKPIVIKGKDTATRRKLILSIRDMLGSLSIFLIFLFLIFVNCNKNIELNIVAIKSIV